MKNSMLYQTITWHIVKRIRIFKKIVAQDLVLKLSSRSSFYYRYLVTEMAWNKPWIGQASWPMKLGQLIY